jgi:hypothetical protein
MDSSYTASTTKPIYHGTRIVWYILGIIEILLAFRFLLKFLAANPGAGFTQFVYGTSYIFATPFLAVFHNTRVTTGSVFEWTNLLAMFVYWVIAQAIISLFLMGKHVSTPEAAAKLDQEESA